MENFTVIKAKIKGFIKRYYVNELIKGFILFFAAGLLYLIITLLIEYFFWLNSPGRTFLFWSFILVEIFLFTRFIVYPLLKMLRISRGIDDVQASYIIGKHFPEVKDKLLNVLQLKNNSTRTDLLLASIEQKSKELRPIPFSLAIDYKENLPYLKYAAIPVIIGTVIFGIGKAEVFSSSYERVVNYKAAYEPPAPFSFKINNEDLKVQENQPFILEVVTEGKFVPEEVSIHYNGQDYFVKSISPGVFEYVFEPVQESFVFRLSGNEVLSRPYFVNVVEVPRTLDLKMEFDYPPHTGLDDEVTSGTGNATIPEGTRVKWNLKTKATEKVRIKMSDSIYELLSGNSNFFFERSIFNATEYTISTSNQEVENFENLAYSLKVIKDNLPKIELDHRQDSLNEQVHYFHGKVSDDYGISKVQLVAAAINDNEEEVKKVTIETGKGLVGEFFTVFPDTIALKRGINYEIYFEVVDNDLVNGFKMVRSKSIIYRELTTEEEKNERLKEQKEAIEGIGNTLEELKKSGTGWDEIKRLQHDEKDKDYKSQQQLKNFLRRQKKQNKMMQSFTEKLNNTFKKEENSYNESLREDLQKRVEKREKELQEAEDVLEELEKYANKLDEEGLREKLEEMTRNVEMRERSLKQLLELTKRYYVQEKLQKIAQEIGELGNRQEQISKDRAGNNPEDQDSLNRITKKILEELEELGQENKSLKKPMELGRDENEEKEIPEVQEKALEELKNAKLNKAKQQQEKAAEKMKILSSRMQQQMEMGGRQQMQEDVNMLRQILDNLITFSFEQEEVMESFKGMGNNSASFSTKLREQNFLKENFQHIDDSIYALALRNPMINEKVNEKLVDVNYNLEKSLARLSQNEIHTGIGSEQYVVTGANDLAFFLSNILENLQQMMNPSAKGGEGDSGKGMQLQDIIKKQGRINERMQKNINKRNGENGKGDGGDKSEKEKEELFRIFQEQQMLRNALEEKMKEQGNDNEQQSLPKEMEQIEKEILQNGFDARTLERMQQLEHKLLDLENAEILQGERKERESKSNTREFNKPVNEHILKAKDYFNTTEILNRQTLPLRQIYKQKVIEYFERGDH